jgi:hypothetical protein
MNAFSSSSQAHLHLVIPNLFGYLAEIDEQSQLPFLNKLLAQSTQQIWQYPEFHSTLFALFGLPPEKNLPVAAVSRLVDMNDSETQIWLRADPVHLHADRDQVLLFDHSMFALTQAETDRLVTELNAFFVTDALFFTAPTPQRWYVQLPRLPELIIPPLTELVGRDIHKYMPTGRDKMTWRQRLNEIQMLLYQSPVNIERERRGELSINSVWFWGLGTLPVAPAPRWVEVWSEDITTQGLAKLTHTPYTAPSKHLLNTLKNGDYLLTLTTGMKTDWTQWSMDLETIWFKSLYQALQTRQLAKVWIYPGEQRVFEVTRNSLKHWWKWRKSWRDFV